MKKGFTLIELLAVIVILAIIALIAVPIVLNIINDSKESSVKRSAELYIKAAETAIAKRNLTEKFNPEECVVQTNGDLLCDETKTLAIEMSGKKPSDGTITFSNGKITNFINLKYDAGYVSKGENGNAIVTTTKQENQNTQTGPKLISFTIDGIIGHADEGMTWEAFANDNKYNIFGVNTGVCMENNLCANSTTDRGIWDNDELRFVTSSDTIKENGNYKIDRY